MPLPNMKKLGASRGAPARITLERSCIRQQQPANPSVQRSAGVVMKANLAVPDCNDSVRFTIIGSWAEVSLPIDLGLFYRGGVLIDRRNNTPMEMDAYSLYLALRALELAYGTDYRATRRRLVDAVAARMEECGGFWSHGAWTGFSEEIHMRFTAAAIRLLMEALDDGLVSSVSAVLGALKRHLSYSEALASGTWYLHDSLELAEAATRQPYPVANNRAWGSSVKNCLVLNTHLDTLVTGMAMLRRCDLPLRDREYLRGKLEAGIGALAVVLSTQSSALWRAFAKTDCLVRSPYFRSYSSLWAAVGLLASVFRKVYFRTRQRIRSLFPAFAFPDGYLERDISLRGTDFEYHIVNVYDLARFLIQARESELACDPLLLTRCEELVDAGIDHAIVTPYWHFVVDSMKRDGKAILLCEAIVARLGTRASADVPRHWIDAYCTIRRCISPTPAIAGYDPLSVRSKTEGELLLPGRDTLHLRNGRTLTVDIWRAVYSLEDADCTRASRR